MAKSEPQGHTPCGIQCPKCSANPGCEKNEVHNYGTDSMHRCGMCKHNWR